jgi:iron(III) transport system substrate-binding protein
MRITRRFTIIAAPVWSAGASVARTGAAAAGPLSASQIDLARARAEGGVVIYTSLDTQIVDAMNKVFSAKYGIKVQYFRGGPGDVTSKILAEADAGRPQADIVDAGDLASVLLMKERGLLTPFRSDAESVIAPHLRDQDGTWITNRLTQGIIHYNTQEFGTAPPQHWADLTRPGFNGRLVYSSASNGDHAPRLVTMAEAFGWDLLKKLAATKPLRMQSPQLATQVIERDERGACFLQNDNLALRSKAEGKPTDFVFPTEGVPSEIAASALLRSATHPHAGALYHEWRMSPEGQALQVKGGKYSARSDMAPPVGFPLLSSLKLLNLDYALYKKNRDRHLDQIAAIFGGEWGN